MDKLHSLTPSWEGYDADRSLEKQIQHYTNRFEKMCESVGTDIYLSIYPTRHDRFLRGVLLGLLTMEEALEGQRLSMRLVWLLPSFVFLLALCFIVRTVAELEMNQVSSQAASIINLGLTSGLFSTFTIHIVMSILVIYHWQKQVRRRDQAWETPGISPANRMQE